MALLLKVHRPEEARLLRVAILLANSHLNLRPLLKQLRLLLRHPLPKINRDLIWVLLLPRRDILQLLILDDLEHILLLVVPRGPRHNNRRLMATLTKISTFPSNRLNKAILQDKDLLLLVVSICHLLIQVK
jgi:hypothetical protein